MNLISILQAEKLFLAYTDVISSFKIKETTVELAEYVHDILRERIELTYKKILTYKISNFEENISVTNMEKFDIKTATSLIPVMDNSEQTIEKIIDGIEMYNEYLVNTTQKKLLITFVLKTRLSKSAKLKLKSEYDNVTNLIQDIKKLLLTKKSANSILSQMNNLSQNNMSISEFGDKLTDLFVGLTIAQSDENPTASEILRPINEKLAIKRFADGLRNRRLSTIISARDYSQLKDAVRAAEDEELGQPSSSSNIFNATQRRGNQFNYYRSPRISRPPVGRMTRGHYNSNRGQNNYNYNPRGKYLNNYNWRYNHSRPARQYRGNFVNSSRNRGYCSRGNNRTVCSAQVENSQEPETKESNQFFRT